MKKSRVIPIALVALLAIGVITVEKTISSRITTRVYEVLPRATDVTASLSLYEIPGNIVSDSIKSIRINIGEYALKDSNLKPSLAINARDISKAKPNVIGSLDVMAIIPASTITELADFNDAQIVGDTLQVSVGVRTLNAPKGMSVKSISLSSKGLALTMQGKNIRPTKIGSTF